MFNELNACKTATDNHYFFSVHNKIACFVILSTQGGCAHKFFSLPRLNIASAVNQE